MSKKPIEKILVITPDEQERNFLCDRIKKLQYRFFAVNTTESIMKTIDQEVFHYFFINTNPNDCYGPEILKEISEKNPDSSIISIKSSFEPGDTFSTFNQGVDNLMTIPDELDRLQMILAQTHERKRYIQDIRAHIRELERKNANSEKAIENSFDIVEQTLIDTIKTFVGLLETRSMHIGSHSKHVGTIAKAIAEKYDLKERVRRDIEIGGLLHDIGKIGLTDIILKKTQSYFPSVDMTNKERLEYQKHPIIGQEAVAMVSMLNQVGLYIRHHHERFDGGGYPDGLSGFHIPLGARIINVVDAFEKIVYTVDASKQKDARKLFVKFLRKNKGTVFDTEASEKLLEYMKELEEREHEAEHRLTVEKLTQGMSLARDVYTKSGVLVISRFEVITQNDIKRLNRFLASEMILDSVYVHMPSARRKVKASNEPENEPETRSLEEINYETVKKAISKAKDYATLPEIHDAVTRFISSGKTTRDDINDILRRDPVITLKILRIANSPLLGFSGDVATVAEGTKRLGYAEIRHVVGSVPVFPAEPENSLSDSRHEFWKHLNATAIICRMIGERIGATNTEEYFTAGILHDVGKLALDQLFRKQYARVISLVRDKAIFYRKAERTLFGETHENIASFLLKKWNMPEIIIDTVQNHHAPIDSIADPLMTSAVHLADIIAHMLHIGESGENTVPKYEPFAQQQLRISLADLESFISDIDDELKKSTDLLYS